MLIPKSDTITKTRIDAAIQAAIDEGVKKSWQGQRPSVLAFPIHDGDGPRPSDGSPFGQECHGCWVMTANSKQRPMVKDVYFNDLVDHTSVYSGMYASVSVNFFPYNSNGRKGIGCGLNNIMKIADGEPMGGRSNPEQDFAEIAPRYQQYQAVEAPQQAQSVYPPTSYQPPAYAQPAYPAASAYPAPVAPAGVQPPVYAQPPYPQYQNPPAINPITGMPMP
jgi:hypothetical protein